MKNAPYICIIEDEESISRLISMYLNKENMATKAFFNAEDALSAFSDLKDSIFLPQLIILDLNLPGMSGFDFLEEMKKLFAKNIPPTIILSARDSDEDIIKGLGFGADEFITKPFSPSVLVARIKAILRRQSLCCEKEDSIDFGDFTILLNSCVLKKGNQKIQLSTKEYEVLEYLVKNAGQVLSPDKIYKAIWKVEFGDITAVAVYIQRLRKKIEEDPAKCKYIKTEFGKGYIFSKEAIK
ncbi:MAG: response regulator transcription factor [Treponema sp.]|nr:response regulator transcription factor [Treponema sp.]